MVNSAPLPGLPNTEPTSTVGATPGAFQVSDAGTAQYTIPIGVPPGRAGVEPALSLVYSGTRRNGDLGMGWHLEGLSAITRCPKSFALDGYSQNVTNTSDDRFCLDGKRLEVVNGGGYGAHGTEYRTLIDSFAKVTSVVDGSTNGSQLFAWQHIVMLTRAQQGPDSFEVRLKDGRILTYGTTASSLVVARNGLRHAWLLSVVKDRFGNDMRFEYVKTEGIVPNHAAELYPNAIRPARIVYTGHGATPGNREVHFDYEPRPDPQLTFMQGGVPSRVDQRLWRIRTVVDQIPVKNYVIKYPQTVVDEPGGTLSLIESVKECTRDTEDTCKKPTRFDYVSDSGFEQDAVYAPTLDRDGIQLDANGDGILDFAHRTVTASAVEVSDVEKGILTGGDVYTSYLAFNPVTAEVGIPAYALWRIGKFIYNGLAHQPTYYSNQDISLSTGSRANLFNLVEDFGGLPCSTRGTPGFLVDYDQDGDHDFVGQCHTANIEPLNCGDAGWPGESLTCQEFINGRIKSTRWQLQLARSSGDGHFAIEPNPVLEFVTHGLLNTKDTASNLFYGQVPFAFDVNGDGLQDILACKNLDQFVLYRRYTPPLGFESEPTVFPAPDQLCRNHTPTFMLFDVDGDGVLNLVISSPQGWRVLRYTEANGEPQLSWQSDVFPNVGFSGLGELTTVGDFNGDALQDIWSAHEDTMWLSTGTGRFEPRLLAPRSLPDLTPFGHSPGGTHRQVGSLAFDMKGHGRSDLLETWISSVGSYNTVLSFQARFPDSSLHHFSSLLVPHGNGNATSPLRYQDWDAWRSVSDVDGDGNTDTITRSGKVVYGKGVKSNLLKRVEDGLGNFIEVNYDQGAYEADTACKTGNQFPERCIPRLHGLVSGYSEGFAADGDHPERSYQYRYFNARMSVAGHGWLGFDRVETKAFAGEDLRMTRTTEFQPHQRYGLSTANSGVGVLTPPYAYPLAGLPKKVTVDLPAFQSDIMSSAYGRRIETTNTWLVGTSVDSRPFPKLQERATRVYERESSLDPEDYGVQLTNQIDGFVFDRYGNATESGTLRNVLSQGGAEYTYSIQYFESYDRENWLISNPKWIQTSGMRGAEAAHQKTHFTYYPNGTLHKVARAPGLNDPADHTTTITRDSFGNPVEIAETVTTGQAPRATVIGYDSDSVYPRTLLNTLSEETELLYDERWGAVTQAVDPNDIIIRHAYDDFGRRVETQTPGGSEAISYAERESLFQTAVGLLNERVEVRVERRGTGMTPDGFAVQHLDNYGRPVRTFTAGPDGELIQEYGYDKAGRLGANTLPHLETSTVVPVVAYYYDTLDRITGVSHSDGTYSQRHHATPVSLLPLYQSSWLTDLCPTDGLEGGTSCVDVILDIDQEDRANAVITDFRGQPLRTIDGNNTSSVAPMWSSYRYGAFSRLIETKDNRGNATTYEYDSYGRLESVLDPTSGLTTNTYTGFGELSTTTDAMNRLRTFEYDVLGRLRKVFDGSTLTAQWTYGQLDDPDPAPNAIGRLKEARVFAPSEQAISYHYEPEAPSALLNRGLPQQVNYELDGVEHSVSYTYDDLGRLKQTHYPQGFGGDPIVTENTYDDTGVLTKLERLQGTEREALWSLNPQDGLFEGHLLKRETFGNGAFTNYNYDEDRRLLTRIYTTFQGGLVQTLNYTHQDNGLVETQTDGEENPRRYQYDLLNRLDAVLETLPSGSTDVLPFGYDAIGNLTVNTQSDLGTVNVNYHFNGVSKPSHRIENVVTANGTNTYFYDASGNVMRRVGPDVPGEDQHIDYTPFNLPSSIINGTGESEEETTFEYSAFEDRTIQRGPASTRYAIGDLYQRVVGATPQDTQEQRFALLVGSRQIGEIVRTGATEETFYFHADHLGSPHTITTDSGQVSEKRFDPFGAQVGGTDPARRFGFTGHQHDDDLGLIDMRGRVYDPLAGRFATPDPMMQAPFWSQGLNRYAYVFNDPINHIDPSGFVAEGSLGGGGGFDLPDGFATAAVWGIGGGILGYGIVTELGGLSFLGGGMGALQGAAGGGLAGGLEQFAFPSGIESPGGKMDAPLAAPSHGERQGVASRNPGAPHQATGPIGPPARIAADPHVQARIDALRLLLNRWPDQRTADVGVCVFNPQACAVALEQALVRAAPWLLRLLPAAAAGSEMIVLAPLFIPGDSVIAPGDATIVQSSSSNSDESSEHTKNARESTRAKHEEGQARKARDRGGEKGDAARDVPRKRPPNWRGPWPPP